MRIGLLEAVTSQISCTSWLIIHQKNVIFQDGGQTVDFEAKDNKDIIWRPYFYLWNEPMQMIVGQVEAEKSRFFFVSFL